MSQGRLFYTLMARSVKNFDLALQQSRTRHHSRPSPSSMSIARISFNVRIKISSKNSKIKSTVTKITVEV